MSDVTMTADERATALAALGEDGDTFELADGRLLRLKVEPDDYDPFNDSDCYGKIALVQRHPERIGDRARPKGFTGAAEKLSVQGDRFWWQPPADVKRTDDGFEALRSTVLDLFAFGCHYLRLELCEGVDGYGQPIVREWEGMGGVEPFADHDHVASIVGDLLSELPLDKAKSSL